LLCETLRALAPQPLGGVPHFVSTRHLFGEDARTRRKLPDWREESQRNDVLKLLLEMAGFSADVRRGPPHYRALQIEAKDKTSLRLWLDQGFAYWQIAEDPPQFDANADARSQAEELAKLNVRVQACYDHDFTPIFVEIFDPSIGRAGNETPAS
jgi:hypothetical protein